MAVYLIEELSQFYVDDETYILLMNRWKAILEKSFII